MNNGLRAHPGRGVNVFQVCQLFAKAYGKAASVDIAVNGFRKAGIFPVDRSVFGEYEFSPATVMDRSDPPTTATTSTILMDEPDRIDPLTTEVLMDQSEPLNVTPCSVSAFDEVGSVVVHGPLSHHTLENTVEEDKANESNCPTQLQVKVTDISPLPKKIYNAYAPRRRQSTATVLTSYLFSP